MIYKHIHLELKTCHFYYMTSHECIIKDTCIEAGVMYTSLMRMRHPAINLLLAWQLVKCFQHVYVQV